MIHLRPCPACRRHVRAEEQTCVFCAAPLPEAPPAPRLAPGRFTRAAVFAGAAVIGAAGAAACGGGLGKADTTPQTAPSQPFYQQQTGGGVADAGTPPPPPAVDAGTPFIDHHIEPMPYGAPPARDRRA